MLDPFYIGQKRVSRSINFLSNFFLDRAQIHWVENIVRIVWICLEGSCKNSVSRIRYPDTLKYFKTFQKIFQDIIYTPPYKRTGEKKGRPSSFFPKNLSPVQFCKKKFLTFSTKNKMFHDFQGFFWMSILFSILTFSNKFRFLFSIFTFSRNFSNFDFWFQFCKIFSRNYRNFDFYFQFWHFQEILEILIFVINVEIWNKFTCFEFSRISYTQFYNSGLDIDRRQKGLDTRWPNLGKCVTQHRTQLGRCHVFHGRDTGRRILRILDTRTLGTEEFLDNVGNWLVLDFGETVLVVHPRANVTANHFALLMTNPTVEIVAAVLKKQRVLMKNI